MTEAHYLSMLIIGFGSFLFGILPIVLSFRMTRFHPFCLSLILCLGAGVLLATSLVHMLTEVQLKLKLSTQLYFCAGFLTLYAFDEISHYCLNGREVGVNSECVRNHKRCDTSATHESPNFSENSPFLEQNTSKNYETLPSANHLDCGHFSGRSSRERSRRESQQSILNAYLDLENDDQLHVTCHSEGNRSANSAAKTGLLIALLVHSVMEGVSIGVQTEVSQVLLILGAVTFHKIVLSFCLGLELQHNGCKKIHLIAAIFLFSIGSPIGISIGMTVIAHEHGIFGIEAHLQAIAAGSLLYVAAFEVLPRERFKWQRNNQKGAGILQLIFVLLGFTLITVFHFYIDPLEGRDHMANITEKLS